MNNIISLMCILCGLFLFANHEVKVEKVRKEGSMQEAYNTIRLNWFNKLTGNPQFMLLNGSNFVRNRG